MPPGNRVKTSYANTSFRQFEFDTYPQKEQISAKQMFMLLGATYTNKRSAGTSGINLDFDEVIVATGPDRGRFRLFTY